MPTHRTWAPNWTRSSRSCAWRTFRVPSPRNSAQHRSAAAHFSQVDQNRTTDHNRTTDLRQPPATRPALHQPTRQLTRDPQEFQQVPEQFAGHRPDRVRPRTPACPAHDADLDRDRLVGHRDGGHRGVDRRQQHQRIAGWSPWRSEHGGAAKRVAAGSPWTLAQHGGAGLSGSPLSRAASRRPGRPAPMTAGCSAWGRTLSRSVRSGRYPRCLGRHRDTR